MKRLATTVRISLSRSVSFILISLTLWGCGAKVRSNLEAFHELPNNGNAQSVVILSANKEKEGSIEFRTYREKLAAKLRAEGYNVIPAASGVSPKYVAYFAYGIDDGQLISQNISVPQWGVTGYTGGQTTGTFNTFGNTTTYSGTTNLNPSYGITGYSTSTVTSQVYTRAIVLDFYDVERLRANQGQNMKAAQVYSGKLTSSGSCGSVSAVLDSLLEALFKDFPGQSGTARTIDVPFDPSNC